MSGIVRTVNSTGRKKILREHVRMRLAGSSVAPRHSIEIEFALAEYAFTSDATVHIEAEAPGFWQRFDLGAIARLKQTVPLEVECPCTADLLSFRLKVTGRRRGESRPLLLGEAKGLRLELETSARSLLPIHCDPDLKHLSWCLDFGDDHPLLRISKSLTGDHTTFARSSAFRSLVGPEVLRQVLGWALQQCEACDLDGDSPAARWIRFGCCVNGDAEPPSNLFDADPCYEELREEWQDSVIRSFCKRHAIADVFRRWWHEGAE